MKRLISKIRAFFYVFSRSIVSPTYYKDILETKPRFTSKYFITLAVTVSVATAILMTIQITPMISKAIDNVATSAKDTYPQDFEVTVKDQEWTINKAEPYMIPMPENLYNEISKDTQVKIPRNLITFDKKGTIDDVFKYDTLALINDKYILTIDDKNAVQSSPLQRIPNGKLDKATFENFVNHATNIKRFVPFLLGAGTLVFSLIFNAFIRLIGLLSVAILVWLTAKILKLELTYQQAVRITLHAATLPFTVNLMMMAFNISIPVIGIFYLTALLYAFVVLITINDIKKQTVLESQ
jgi:hypothetical protein